MVFRSRYVGRGMREDLTIRNFADEPAMCTVELLVGCDFADLFAVKEGRVGADAEPAGAGDAPRCSRPTAAASPDGPTTVTYSHVPERRGPGDGDPVRQPDQGRR